MKLNSDKTDKADKRRTGKRGVGWWWRRLWAEEGKFESLEFRVFQ